MKSVPYIAEALLFLGVVAVLAWFAWHLILRRLYRARRIRHIHMHRLMREAAARPDRHISPK